MYDLACWGKSLCFFYIAAPPTEAPTMVTTIAVLSPPTLMSANRTSLGVLLQWVPPLEESPPLTSFALQAKRGKGEWVTIDREIAINLTELIVQGLVKVNVWNIENMAAWCWIFLFLLAWRVIYSSFISTGLKLWAASSVLQGQTGQCAQWLRCHLYWRWGWLRNVYFDLIFTYLRLFSAPCDLEKLLF